MDTLTIDRLFEERFQYWCQYQFPNEHDYLLQKPSANKKARWSDPTKPAMTAGTYTLLPGMAVETDFGS